MVSRVVGTRYLEASLWVLAIVLAALLLLGMARPASGTPAADGRVTDQPPRVTVASPCEGYFLVAEYPGGVPLVELGTVVKPNTIVGYVQSMGRTPTPVRSGVTGTVVEILFDDLAPVTMGDPLFRIEVHR